MSKKAGKTIVAKVTDKNGVECTKLPSCFTFKFTCTQAKVDLIELTRTGGLYPLLVGLNKDGINAISTAPVDRAEGAEGAEGVEGAEGAEGGAEYVFFKLFMNYFDDETGDLVLPLVNTTKVHSPTHAEISGQYYDDYRCASPAETVIKIAAFQLTLGGGDLSPPAPPLGGDLSSPLGGVGGDLSCSLLLRLAEPMNVLRENTLCLVLQKILGRLKSHVSGVTEVN